MANRYWILGAGNWNDPLHWSTTSGGVGGASVPTMNDDVYFDSNSGTGTVTVNAIANMRNCTFAQTQLITITNAAYAFNIYGNWTLCSNTYLATSFTGTGYVYLKATTSVNITSNGCTRSWNRLNFDGVNGTWTNQDDWNCESIAVYHTNGTWNTNGFVINFNEWRLGEGTKILNAGSSLLKSKNGFLWHIGNTGFSFNKDSCTIEVNGGGWAEFGGKVFNDVYLKHVGSNSQVTLGGITCENLYIQPASGNILNAVYVGANTPILINNTLNITGINSSNYRHLISSNIIGTPRTITCNGTITASNVDFRDITLAGTCNKDLSGIIGGSGDCGGNSGITFTAAQKQYFKHTLGAVNWSDATKWFSNYERTIAGRVPLPQDDAIFDENSFTGASTLNVNVPRIGRNLNMEEVNQAVGFALVTNIECYGDISMSSHIISIESPYLSITGRGKNIYLDIKTTLNVNYVCGHLTTFTLLNDFTSTKNLNFGNWEYYGYDFNDYNVTVNQLHLSGLGAGTGLTRKLGNGTHTLNSHFCYLHPADFEGSTVIVDGKLYNCDNANYNILELKNSNTINMGTSYAPITVKELRLTAGKTYTLKSTVDPRQVFYIGKLTAIGTPDQPITIGSTTAGQRHTINYTGSEASTVEYCNVSDSKVTQARQLLAKNSVNGGNNQNWGFDTLPALTLNKKQVDKMYVGDKLVTAIYKGTAKIY